MGKLWGSGDGVDIANLNSPVVFDARVSASAGATSGTTYPTVALALAAGKKSIYVDAADYADGFTVTGNNVLVLCGVAPGYDGGFQGATFGGQVTVSGNFVQLQNVHVVGSAAYGIRVDLGYLGVRLINCNVYQSALAGFYLAYQGALTTASFDCEAHGCVANDCGGTLYDGFYFGDYDYAMEWLLAGCRSFANGRDGFSVCSNAVAAVNAAYRIVTLRDCLAFQNGAHGLRCGGRASVNVQAGHYRDNASAGIYLSTQETSLARSQVMGARVRANTGAGVQLQAASASQILIGVQAYGNGTNFINCGSCIGYAGTSTNNNGV